MAVTLEIQPYFLLAPVVLLVHVTTVSFITHYLYACILIIYKQIYTLRS